MWDFNSDQMAEAYRLVLRLDAAGADVALIASVLDIEPEAVAPLLAIAHRKLASLRPVTHRGPAAISHESDDPSET